MFSTIRNKHNSLLALKLRTSTFFYSDCNTYNLIILKSIFIVPGRYVHHPQWQKFTYAFNSGIQNPGLSTLLTFMKTTIKCPSSTTPLEGKFLFHLRKEVWKTKGNSIVPYLLESLRWKCPVALGSQFTLHHSYCGIFRVSHTLFTLATLPSQFFINVRSAGSTHTQVKNERSNEQHT